MSSHGFAGWKAIILLVLLAKPVTTLAGGHGGGGMGHGHGFGLGAVGSAVVAWPYMGTYGYGGVPTLFSSPVMVFAPQFNPQFRGARPAIGPALPPPAAFPARGNFALPQRPPLVNELPKPAETARARQMATYGDRLFRSGNLHRAGERYEQALRADSSSTSALVGLAQVAIARGQFTEAGQRFRQTLEVQPNWLVNAPDVQALYGEPADFAKSIARIESHLQANPNDREAWFVLGVQWYLSGRTGKAADVFMRLSDRKADPALAAFLEASTPDAR
jgi:hypothetical protein